MEFLRSFSFRHFNLDLPQRLNLSQERVVLMAGVVLFSLMGSFVLWGPSQNRRKRIKNAIGVKGLVNMGETCFLNSLLQAVAASPMFCEWLSRHQHESDIAGALFIVLQYVNGEVAQSDTSHNPRSVVKAMEEHGWSLGMGQQDSHELFFALMACLEEQTSLPSRPQDILTQLLAGDTSQAEETDGDTSTPQANGLAVMVDDPKTTDPLENGPKTTNPLQNDTKTADPLQNSPKTADSLENGPKTMDPLENGAKTTDTLENGPKTVNPLENGPKTDVSLNNSPPRENGRCSFVCRTGGRFSGVPQQQRTDFPFRGQQLSQLSCTVCSRASVVQHQAFDCLSLPLPLHGSISLEQLLATFTAPEQVHQVQCAHCTAAAGPAAPPIKTTFVKQLSIGRLPKCLCIHIQRTSWLSNGQAYKRHDFVAFPELLVMDKFTYCHKERVRRMLLQQLQPAATPQTVSNGDCHTTQLKDRLQPRHLYKLRAVVVHLGDVTAGHFVTYRRPPAAYCSKYDSWVCVSDEECRPASLEDVLQSRAYLLFYEKTLESPLHRQSGCQTTKCHSTCNVTIC